MFTNEDTPTVPVIENMSDGNKLNDICITEVILKQPQSLNISKSSEFDGFHLRVLKEVAQSIITPLRILYT